MFLSVSKSDAVLCLEVKALAGVRFVSKACIALGRKDLEVGEVQPIGQVVRACAEWDTTKPKGSSAYLINVSS